MIKASADAEIRGLLEALDADRPARREAAIARLTVLGSRAVPRLVAAYDLSSREKQLAILQVLETFTDVRALPVARRALDAGGDLAVAAVAVLREFVARGTGTTHTDALETLLSVSANPAIERRVKAAAVQALSGAAADVRGLVDSALPATGSPEDVVWEEAAEGRLPEGSAAMRDALAGHAEEAELPVLRRVIETIRLHEDRIEPPRRREEWTAVRGALHETLARRGSRLALYDLRETLERTAAPLPAGFLSAVAAIGDASCLEPLALAFSRAPASASRWRGGLAETFHAIRARERLTRRHAAVRRALARAPELAS